MNDSNQVDNATVNNKGEKIKIYYPGSGTYSQQAVNKFKQEIQDTLENLGIDSSKFNREIEVIKIGDPKILAEKLDNFLDDGIVLLPVNNNNGGNVTPTVTGSMNYCNKTGKLPRIIYHSKKIIKHLLLGKPGQSPEQLEKSTIYSHWQAIKQCRIGIDKLGIEAENVNGTTKMLEDAGKYKGVLLLADEKTAKENGLEIYSDKVCPEENNTTFIALTGKEEEYYKDLFKESEYRIGRIEPKDKTGGLLLSLLPLVLLNGNIDLKEITSDLETGKPQIGIFGKGKTFIETKRLYNVLKQKNNGKIIKFLMGVFKNLLSTDREYDIKVEKNNDGSFILNSNNKPGALIKMLILFVYKSINLSSISSEVDGNKAFIKVKTDEDITNLLENIDYEDVLFFLEKFIKNNLDYMTEIEISE